MSDRDLIDAVAHFTGQDSHEIRRCSFTLTGPGHYDPEEAGRRTVAGSDPGRSGRDATSRWRAELAS